MAAGTAGAGPVGEGERIAELDVLRGVALLGVLIMNFVAFASAGAMATAEQLKALPTIAIDDPACEAVRLFVGDKANTVFATLFGLGFYLQLKRGAGRPGFESRYRRRLSGCWSSVGSMPSSCGFGTFSISMRLPASPCLRCVIGRRGPW